VPVLRFDDRHAVLRCRISVSMLAWLGSRCGTSTKPMPVSAGQARKKASKASSPPAEAPMPTMAKGAGQTI
jgi:hypothetical protein